MFEILTLISTNHPVKTIAVTLADGQQFFADFDTVFFNGLNFGDGYHVRFVDVCESYYSQKNK